jgi:putative ABC transport system substrate-binding protein
MKRREFITLLGGAAAAWPLTARAQQSKGLRRLGALQGSVDPQATTNRAALISGNIQIDYRSGEANVERMRAIAKELIGLKPDLLWASTTPAVAALQRETRMIPIVFVAVSDPVGSGFVASLPRPGGNITGFINIEGSVSGKWIEILKDIVPDASRAALMYNPETAPYFEYYRQPFEAAARSSGVEPIAGAVRTADDIERIVASLGDRGATGLVLAPDAFVLAQRNLDLVINLAARYRVAAIYPYRYCVAAGGLISYGVDIVDLYRRSATYVDRILKGDRPADLPVQLPTKFELAVNLKTAKALGLTIPAILQATADQVIE